MSSDPGDLANLADLVLPPTISLWPPAAGVWILGGTAVVALAVAGWRGWLRYRADAYLRRARAELGEASSIEQISSLLKRAAMVAYGRERVASLTGAGWAAFIRETAPVGKPVERLAFCLDTLSATGEKGSTTTAAASVLAEAEAWLRSQRGLVSGRR